MNHGELQREHRTYAPSPRARDALLHEPTVSMFVLRAMLDLLAKHGASRSELLERVGLAQQEVDRVEARIPRRELDRACAMALTLTGDAALGLHWAEHISHRTFAPASHMLSYVSELRQAFALLEKFAPLFADEPFFALHEQGKEARVEVIAFSGQSPAVARFTAELSMAGFFVMLRAVGPGLRLRRVCFAHHAPQHHAEYDRVFGQRVRFAQPYTGLVFDAAALDAPLQHGDEDALSALCTVAETRMLRSTRPRSFGPRLHELLVRRAPERFSMGTAAKALGVSERSLRRRLAEEGTSFGDVEHGALAAIARQLLQREQRTIKETAYAMGFSDMSAFHRAFKRWTGTTPSAYQARGPR